MTTRAEHEVSPSAAMMGLVTGYWVSQAVGVVALLGVADRERTEEEYRRLLRAAGFRLERVIPTRPPFSVIEATRV